MYAAITLIPMVLPLATLFAAVMTMGNMGKNYELLALKSAGVSLPRTYAAADRTGLFSSPSAVFSSPTIWCRWRCGRCRR